MLNKQYSGLVVVLFGFVFLFAMHYLQLHIGGWGLSIPSNTLVWIGGISLFGIALHRISTFAVFRYRMFSLVFFISLFLFILPIAYSNTYDVSESFQRLLGLVAGFLFYLSLNQLIQRSTELDLLLRIAFWGVFIQAFYGLFQLYYFNGEVFSGYMIATSFPSGVSQQPNVMASLLVTGMALGFYLYQNSNKYFLWFIPLFMGVATWLLWHLESRIGYLSLVVLMLCICVDIMVNRRYKNLRLIAVVMVVFSVASLISDADRRRGDVDSLSKVSSRMSIYTTVTAMILDKPLLGWGYGSFYPAFTESYAQRQKANENVVADVGALYHPHNEIMMWWVEGGIAPLIAMFVLSVYFLKILRKNKENKILLLGGVLPLLLHSMVEYPFYHSAVHWLLFLLLIFVIDFYAEDAQEKPLKLASDFKLLAYFVPICVALFMLSSLYTLSVVKNYEQRRLAGRYADASELLKVLNPVPYTQVIDRTVHVVMLRQAMESGDRESIHRYIDWAEKSVVYNPNKTVLQGLEIAYLLLEDNVSAAAWKARLFDLYPKDPSLKKNAFLVKRYIWSNH